MLLKNTYLKILKLKVRMHRTIPRSPSSRILSTTIVRKSANFRRFIFAFSTGLILISCGVSKTAEDYLADADAFEQAGDIAAAILEVKNAVQLEPDNREARLKLGQLQLAGGNFASALKELEKSRNYGGANDELNRAITRALIMLGEHEQAATELALHGDFKNFEWRNLQATLDLRVGRFEDARDTFAELLAASPEDAELRACLLYTSDAADDLQPV